MEEKDKMYSSCATSLYFVKINLNCRLLLLYNSLITVWLLLSFPFSLMSSFISDIAILFLDVGLILLTDLLSFTCWKNLNLIGAFPLE